MRVIRRRRRRILRRVWEATGGDKEIRIRMSGGVFFVVGGVRGKG